MSFLSKSKELINKTAGGPPPRPGMPPKTGTPPRPGGAPPRPGMPPAPPKPVAQEVEVPKGLIDNANPFKVMKQQAEAKEKETVEMPIPVIENKKEEVETPVKTIEKEVPVEETKAEPKKRARRTPAKKTAEPVAVESVPSETVAPVAQPIQFDTTSIKTVVSFEEAIDSIKSGFVDENWEKFRVNTQESLSAIVITNDMNSTALKSVLAELNDLKTELWSKFTDTKSQYEALCVKEPAGLIERVKLLNSKGTNAEERKINGVLAVMNYKDSSGNTINLFELFDEVRERYNFLKGLMDTISYKSNLLITMLGGMKLEK